MSTIRPGLPVALPPSAAPQGAQAGGQAGVRAASADFFRAALAQVQGGAIKPEVTPIRTEPRRDASDGRSLRPGSLLDIRV